MKCTSAWLLGSLGVASLFACGVEEPHTAAPTAPAFLQELLSASPPTACFDTAAMQAQRSALASSGAWQQLMQSAAWAEVEEAYTAQAWQALQASAAYRQAAATAAWQALEQAEASCRALQGDGPINPSPNPAPNPTPVPPTNPTTGNTEPSTPRPPEGGQGTPKNPSPDSAPSPTGS